MDFIIILAISLLIIINAIFRIIYIENKYQDVIKEVLDIIDNFPALDPRDYTKEEKLMKLLEIKNLLNEVIKKWLAITIF